MTRTRLALPLAAAAAALLSGCLPKRPFVPVEDGAAFVGPDDAYDVVLPSGWNRLNDDEDVLVTRDGPTLQRITIMRRDPKKPLPRSKRIVTKGMEPYEIAELIAGEISSAEGITGVKIVENAPARVGGVPGFKLVTTYKDEDGLRMTTVSYGALHGQWLWALAYSAPARHYYPKDLPTFEKVVSSFRLAPAQR